MSPHHFRQSIACTAYVALHVLSHVSASAFEVSPGISLWYPPCGLALSLLVLLGPRFAPVVLLANIATALIFSGLKHWWSPLVFPALITGVNTLAAIVTRRWIGPSLLPGGRRATLAFWSIVGATPALTAALGTGLLIALGITPAGSFLHDFGAWWVGDLTGVLTIVPVAMVFGEPWLRGQPLPGWTRRRDPAFAVAVAARLLALAFCLGAVFAFEPFRHYNALYLCFLPVIWIALRHGLAGAVLATLLVTVVGLIALRSTAPARLLIGDFLLFELAMVSVGLGLGAAVSSRNRAERRVAASEARLGRVITGAQLGLWDWHVASGRISYNDEWAAMLGYQLSEIDTDISGWTKLVHPDDVARVRAAWDDHFTGRTTLFEVEYRARTRDQHWRWVRARGSVVVRDALGAPLMVSGTQSDITARRLAEAETARLRNVLAETTDFVLRTDSSGIVQYTNASCERLLPAGATAAGTRCDLERVFPEEALALLRREAMPAAAAAGTWHGETAVRAADGREVPVSLVLLAQRDEYTEDAMYFFVMRDISRQRQAQAERIANERKLLQIQKLESLGVLAGGIAHDFNNLLTVMLGNTSLARLELPADASAQPALEQVERAGQRAADLCRQMLAYAGRSPLTFSPLNLSTLVEETTRLLRSSIGKKTVLDLQLSAGALPILADASQIRQVVMNLALNASDAIGPRGGRITLRTQTVWLDSRCLDHEFHAPQLGPGSYVLLEVADDGCGMPPEVQARIFEPFFTTKFTGHGLGLAGVLGIVKSHRGAIQVVSEPGAGSTFRVIFPGLENETVPPESQTSDDTDWREQGHVLVVDDDPAVRTVITRTLESVGLSVSTAHDGPTAVDFYRTRVRDLRFVLLDLTMPGMDGEETFQQLRAVDPGVPVVLMSGFSEKLSVERFAHARPAAFLAKPFSRDALRACLRQIRSRNN